MSTLRKEYGFANGKRGKVYNPNAAGAVFNKYPLFPWKFNPLPSISSPGWRPWLPRFGYRVSRDRYLIQ